jgi:polyisoprenyl-teichoic acid--peptidoglycan teichoic acid transferase
MKKGIAKKEATKSVNAKGGIDRDLKVNRYRTDRLLVGLTAFVGNAVFYAVWRSHFVPNRFVLMVCVGGNGALILAMKLIKILIPKKLRLIATFVMCILVIAACLVAYKNLRATTDFVARITTSPAESYTQYDILKQTTLTRQPNPASPFILAFLSVDLNSQALMDAVQITDSYKRVGYANTDEMIKAIAAGQVDEIVLTSAFTQVAKETYPDAFSFLTLDRSVRVKDGLVVGSARIDTSNPFIVYISGIDTYGEIETTARSDVNILAVINPLTHKILLVNTPRDYYVQLHGTTGVRDKLTHAGLYGVDSSAKTLEDLYGVSIPSYVRINFTSFQKVIDTLGGVDVYSDQSFSSYVYSYNQGVNSLGGVEALEFARERYTFQDGDRTRGKNQQRVIEAVLSKASSPRLLVQYTQLLGSLDGNVQTNIAPGSITDIVKAELSDIQKWQVESISVDGTGASAQTFSFGSQELYVMVPSQETVDVAKLRIQEYLRL